MGKRIYGVDTGRPDSRPLFGDDRKVVDQEGNYPGSRQDYIDKYGLAAYALKWLGVPDYSQQFEEYGGNLKGMMEGGLFEGGLNRIAASKASDISGRATDELSALRGTLGLGLGDAFRTGLSAKAAALAEASKTSSFGDLMMEMTQKDAEFRNQARQNYMNLVLARAGMEQNALQFYRSMRFQFGERIG